MTETEFRLTVNGAERSVTCEPDTPLLDVLRHDLGLAGPKFGCGMGLCGACFVLIGGRARASCDLPVSAVAGPVTTVEGLPGGGAAPPGPAGVHRRAGRPVRLLHLRHGDGRGRPAARPSRPDRAGGAGGSRRQPVPLRDARQDHPRGAEGSRAGVRMGGRRSRSPPAGQVLVSQVPAAGTPAGEGPVLAPPSGSPRPWSPVRACRRASPRSRPTWRRTRCWPGGWISAGTGRSRSGPARWSTARASGPRWRRWPRRNSRSPWPGCGWPRCPPAPARTRVSRRAACRSRTPARRSGRRARRPVTCCWTPLRPGSGSPLRHWPWPTGRSGPLTVRPG